MNDVKLVGLTERTDGVILAHGIRYDEQGVTVSFVENGIKLSHNLAMTIYVDGLGEYLDFTKTRYKSLGKVRI